MYTSPSFATISNQTNTGTNLDLLAKLRRLAKTLGQYKPIAILFR